MKARSPSGQALIIFETDLSYAKSFCEEELSHVQKEYYEKFSESQKEQIRQGYGAVYRDLETGTDLCSFNMDTYKPPKKNLDRLAKSLLDACKEYYSNPENVKKFEGWKKQKTRRTGKRGNDTWQNLSRSPQRKRLRRE